METTDLPDDLRQCVTFHGYLCPGVVTGYCAAKLAMRELAAERSDNEDLVAIVENDTCAVDAIQVLTGCTFGKGNLFFRDHGKMVFTLARRTSKRSVRLRLQPKSQPKLEDVPEEQRRGRLIRFMLTHDPAGFFDIGRDTLANLPPETTTHESIPCDRCGEMVIPARIRQRGERNLCIPCDEKDQRQRNTP